jgi:hypothetical protein
MPVLLVVVLAVLALSACGGGGSAQEAKGRPLPQDQGALRPGQYHSVEFKPALSFEVGKGWINSAGELPDFIERGQLGGFVSLANVKEVYRPDTTDVVEAPKDLVGWLEHHPYLKTSKPKPLTLGGVKGEQLEVLVEDLPEDYYGLCGEGLSNCVDIAPLSNDEAAAYREVFKRKVVVLEEVKGDTVMIWFAGPPNTFDEFASKAQKVLDSAEWKGA